MSALRAIAARLKMILNAVWYQVLVWIDLAAVNSLIYLGVSRKGAFLKF